MTSTADTGSARLEAEGRLLNPVVKGPAHRAGRYSFRGDRALRFVPKIADAARPPEPAVDQLLATAEAGTPTTPFVAAFLLSVEYLKPLAEVWREAVTERHILRRLQAHRSDAGIRGAVGRGDLLRAADR